MILAAFLLLAQNSEPEPARAILERWRDSIELDLPQEVVDSALPLVTDRGRLAEDGEAIALAARALSAAGDRSRAEKLLEAARPVEASQGFVEVARARLALERDDLEGARGITLSKAGSDVPVRYPAVPECWLLGGRALARSGKPAEAVPLLERFLALAPLDAEAPTAWHMLAQAAISRGDSAAAAELRQRALASAEWQDFYRTRRIQVREKPDEPLPRLGIAELFLAAGAHERALSIAGDLTARWPDFCRGHEALGRAERGLGRLVEARAALERAIACDPNAARSHLELARVLLALGEKDASSLQFARYRELGGNEPIEPR
jgi:tetratricopeptide (TPR) repeat protein